MQLQAGLVKIVCGVSVILMLVSCDTAVNADDDVGVIDNTEDLGASTKADSYVAPSGNPCIDSWVVEGIKDRISESAQSIIENNKGFDELNQRLLNSASMTFNYISEPMYQDGGNTSCSAQVDVVYNGNEQTDDSNLVKLVTGIKQSSFTGYMLGTGINAYNIDDYHSIESNNFSTNIDYDIGTTYSESGEPQQSYSTNIDTPASMLALVVMIDRVAQDKLKD